MRGRIVSSPTIHSNYTHRGNRARSLAVNTLHLSDFTLNHSIEPQVRSSGLARSRLIWGVGFDTVNGGLDRQNDLADLFESNKAVKELLILVASLDIDEFV